MTFAVRVDASDPTPPYEQLRRQLAGAIRGGTLASGTRLPTVRQLAADLGLATGTVMRAYGELEASGLVVTRRGQGTVVADLRSDAVGVRLGGLADRFIADAVAAGAGPAEVRAAIDAALSRRGA
ncbi:MAG: GntR family transcriptional regulator [Nigerium sp.]|nr:GntR family transcriptional regulator [Nigerium sp.]